jgi:hypothetical protein
MVKSYSTANHDEGTFPPHFLLDSLPATTMIIPYPKRATSSDHGLPLALQFNLSSCSFPFLGSFHLLRPTVTIDVYVPGDDLGNTISTMRSSATVASCRALQRRRWLPFSFPRHLRLLGRDFSASLPGQESVRIRLCISIDSVKSYESGSITQLIQLPLGSGGFQLMPEKPIEALSAARPEGSLILRIYLGRAWARFGHHQPTDG